MSSAHDIGRRGKQLYEGGIKAIVEKDHRGKYVAIDVNTGDYEIDSDRVAAAGLLRQRRPDAVVFFVRIGMPPVRLGGRTGRVGR
jgi:hypothetical protein